MLSLLMLLAMQDAPAQDGPFHHGVWTGQCWLTGMKAGPLCRGTGGQAGKLWIMIERSPAKMDIYASGACGEDLPPVTLTQAQLAGVDRVRAVNAAIGEAAAKANAACKTNEAFAGTEADLGELLTETDRIAGTAK
jgi:hypothetical protein